MRNDKEILEVMKEIYNSAAYFIDFVESINPCAHTDRMIERVIAKSEELKKLYYNNFEGGK